MTERRFTTYVFEGTYRTAAVMAHALGEAEEKIRAAGGTIDREHTICASFLRGLKPKPGGGWWADWTHLLVALYYIPLGTPDPLRGGPQA